MLDKIKEIANDTPEKTALYYKDQQLTYNELAQKIELCVKRLQELNIKKDTIVPIYMNTDFDVIITIYSIVTLGAIYVPLSIQEPYSKIENILGQLDTNLLLTNIEKPDIKNIAAVNLNHDDISNTNKPILNKIENEDLAYIMFTSGSTGSPKGVKITNSNLDFILNVMQKDFPINPNQKYILSTPYSFDVSVLEIFGWVSGGGSLVLYDISKATSLRDLTSQIAEKNVTHLALSPSTLEILINYSTPEELTALNINLRYLLIAGEEFKANLAKKTLQKLPDVELNNLYGPTETTVYATKYKVESNFDQEYVPIGEPLDFVTIKIVDEEDNETDGKGEILIGGSGVARGYLSKDLDDNIFLYLNGAKYYRTGDYGQIESKGNVKFLGRKDDQVQINGVRVELKAIENSIEKFSNKIISTKILFKKNKLYCFYSSSLEVNEDDLKEYLKKVVSKNSIPHFFIKMDKLPLNKNNKVDTKELEKLISKDEGCQKDFTSGNNSTRDRLRERVNALFGVKDYSDEENFENLGLDSLDYMTLTMSLEDDFNIKLSDGFLYQYNSIEKLEGYLDNYENEKMISRSEVISYDSLSNLEKIYKVNNELVNNSRVTDRYDTHYLQKLYVFDDFLSYLDIVIDIPGDYSLEQVKESIHSLILNNEMFRVTLKKEHETLIFEERDFFVQSLTIPVIKQEKGSTLNLEIQRVRDANEAAAKQDTLGMQYLFTIMDTTEGYKVVLTVSHNIADGSNEHIINKEFQKIISRQELPKKDKYVDYINYLKAENSLEKVLDDKNTKEIEDAFNNVDYDKSKYKNADMLFLKLPNIDSKNINDLVTTVNYISVQLFCKSTGVDRVLFSTIMNIRDFETDLKLEGSIGDYHSSFTVVGYKNEEFTPFKERVNDLINQYKDGYNPIHSIFMNYPKMTEEQQRLENMYDLAPYVKTNFSGYYRKKDLRDLFESQEKVKKQLSNFPVDTIYINAFKVENDLYFSFLTSPHFKDDLLDEFNLEIVDMESLNTITS